LRDTVGARFGVNSGQATIQKVVLVVAALGVALICK